jgi:hypothetical protein
MPTDHAGSDARQDHEALLALSVAYAAAADARDGEGLASLFVEDGALVVPKLPTDLRPVVTRAGHDALRQVAEVLRRYDRTFHLVSNARFEVAGDDASGEVQCVAHHVTAAHRQSDAAGSPGAAPPGTAPPGAAPAGTAPAGTDTVWFIRYRDRYRRSGPAWRFVRRELHLQWVEEHPVATMGAPPEGRS